MKIELDLATALTLIGGYTAALLAGFLWLSSKLNSLMPRHSYEKLHESLERRVRLLELHTARYDHAFKKEVLDHDNEDE